MNRRAFLAAAAVAPAAAARGAVEPPAMTPVIDTHQHLWDLTKFKLSWLEKGTAFDASFTPKEYAEATAGLNVVKAIYMEVDVVPEQQQAEADYVVALCAAGKTATCAAVVSGRPDSEEFAKYATQFKDHKYVKGVRRVLHAKSTPPGFCLAPAFVKGIQLLGELGLSFDLCVRPAELPDMVKLVSQCPGTRFILDHCGNGSVKFTPAELAKWKTDMAAIAAKPNVVGKISGFVATADKGKWKADDLAPVVNHTWDVFGPDRVMFGGDWPVCLSAATYKEWLTALRQIAAARPEGDQKKLFHDNAAKFYGV